MMKPATKMMPYQNLASDKDETDILLATTILPRSPNWMMTARSMGLVAVGVVLMLLAGAVLMQDGSTEFSGSFAPTRKTFMAQYPELIDRSTEEQDFQYQAYLLSLNGMLSAEELDGDKANSFGLFSCCFDEDTSTGCRYIPGKKPNPKMCLTDPSAPDTECEFAGHLRYQVCCRSFPNNLVGSKTFVWAACISTTLP